MTDEHESNQDTEIVHMGDRTAIIAAGIAIGVSLIAAPGPYTLMNIPIGLVLIVTLHAADNHEDRNRFQSASFALAWALTFLLIAGLFLVNPYITNHNGVYITDNNHPIIDHFTFIEWHYFPFQWIKDTFKDGASDFVSFIIVAFVAVIWYAIRRRRFAVHQPPSQPKDAVSVLTKSSAQLVPTRVPAEQRQEHAMEAMSISTNRTSEMGQLAAKHRSRTPTRDTVTLSVLTAVMALFAYVIRSRWLKHT